MSVIYAVLYVSYIQAAHLLQAPKHSADDIAAISSSCFKLNSVQLRALLEQYKPDQGEMPHVPQVCVLSLHFLLSFVVSLPCQPVSNLC